MDLVTRPAGPEDAADLARLIESFDEIPVTASDVARRLTEVGELETVLLAESAGQVVGFASVRITPFLSGDYARAELTELYVVPERRRQGVGRSLIRHVERLAWDQGAQRVILLTGLRNLGAQAFYRAVGYADCALAMRKDLEAPEAS